MYKLNTTTPVPTTTTTTGSGTGSGGDWCGGIFGLRIILTTLLGRMGVCFQNNHTVI